MPKEKKGVVYYDAESKTDYLAFISEFPRANGVEVGGVYVFSYAFQRNPNFAKTPLKRKWFYTNQPIDLCFHVSPKNKQFSCINLTALPVTVRMQIIKHLKKTQKGAFSENKQRLKFRQLMSLVRLFRKLGVSIRKYNMSRASRLRAVPPEEIENLIQFVSNFWFKGNYTQVVNRYKRYKPKI